VSHACHKCKVLVVGPLFVVFSICILHNASLDGIVSYYMHIVLIALP
jgi:hypothetical protein